MFQFLIGPSRVGRTIGTRTPAVRDRVGAMLKYSGRHYSVSQPQEGGFRLMNRVTDDDASLRPALTHLAVHILIPLGNGPAPGNSIRKRGEGQSGRRPTP